jgi:hypothetical protein
MKKSKYTTGKTIKLDSSTAKAKNETTNEPITLHRLDPIERETHLWINDVDRVWQAESSIKRDMTTLEKQG